MLNFNLDLIKRWNSIPINSKLNNEVYAYLQENNVNFKEIIIKGAILNRIIIIVINIEKCFLVSLNNESLEKFFKNKFFKIQIENPEQSSSYAKLSENDHIKLKYPVTKFISLYKKENFPLPRFPLNISDLAASFRHQGLGEVILTDMQCVSLGKIIIEL